jgi:hypothetical protein
VLRINAASHVHTLYGIARTGNNIFNAQIIANGPATTRNMINAAIITNMIKFFIHNP